MSTICIAVSQEICSLRKNLDESLQKATTGCTNDYNRIRDWLTSCVKSHQICQLDLSDRNVLSVVYRVDRHEQSGLLSPIKEESEISPRVSPTVTKIEIPKVVPSASVAVKKSVPSSPVSSRMPAAPSRRDVLFSQFNGMSMSQLMGELQSRSLRSVGTKSELVERLIAYELKKDPKDPKEPEGLRALQSENEARMCLIQQKEEEHKQKLAGCMASPVKTPTSRVPPAVPKPIGSTPTPRVPEAVSKPVSKPISGPASKPISGPVSKPISSPVSKPISSPGASSVQELKKRFESAQPVTSRVPASPAPHSPLSKPRAPPSSQPPQPSRVPPSSRVPQVPQVPKSQVPQPPQASRPRPPNLQLSPSQQASHPDLPPPLGSPTRRLPLTVAPPPQPVQPAQPAQPVQPVQPVQPAEPAEEENEEWYQSPLLEHYLMRQRNIDPDIIFDVMSTCDLEKVFPNNHHVKQRPRGSSGDWNDDRTRKSLAIIERDEQ